MMTYDTHQCGLQLTVPRFALPPFFFDSVKSSFPFGLIIAFMEAIYRIKIGLQLALAP